jgi:hypothetical protein
MFVTQRRRPLGFPDRQSGNDAVCNTRVTFAISLRAGDFVTRVSYFFELARQFLASCSGRYARSHASLEARHLAPPAIRIPNDLSAVLFLIFKH